MSQYQENATLIRVEHLTDENVRLTLQAETIAAKALPGQFVMVRAGLGRDPLLRRPFSLHQTSRNGEIQILFKIKGSGTNLLAHCREGEQLSVLGPFGKGFQVALDRPACLIGGGMGIAPMLFLSKYLCQEKPSPKKPSTAQDYLIFGGRTAEEVAPLLPDFKQLGLHVLPATDDGSFGTKGFVTDIMRGLDLPQDTVVYCCGPKPMMKQVHLQCTERGLACQVSVESFMGCGMGACLGCNIPAEKGGYVHVCYEGPVFRSEDLVWE